MNRTELQTPLSQKPAAVQWSQSTDGTRSMGACVGAVFDVTDVRAQLAVVLPPDNVWLVNRNTKLLLLFLTALRPKWQGAADWLRLQMRYAPQRPSTPLVNRAEQVSVVWHPRLSRLTLAVEML